MEYIYSLSANEEHLNLKAGEERGGGEGRGVSGLTFLDCVQKLLQFCSPGISGDTPATNTSNNPDGSALCGLTVQNM